MLFDIHMLCETIAVPDVRAYGDIVFSLDVFQGSSLEVQALLKTTEGQALVFFIKPVWPAEQPAGGKRPPLFIISPIQKSLPGEIFPSAVIVDNRDRTLCADVIIIFCNVVLGIGNVDFYPAAVMSMYLVVIDDNLAALFGVAGDIGDRNRPPAPLPARRAYRPEGRAYASESSSIFKCSSTDVAKTRL